MAERYCPSCIANAKCWFDEHARKVAACTPVFDDPSEQRNAAYEAHRRIAEARLEAREMECPHLNDIDPDYPGKKML